MPDKKPEIVENDQIPEELLNEDEQEEQEESKDDEDTEDEAEDEDESEEEDEDDEQDMGEYEDDEDVAEHPSDQIESVLDEIAKQEKRLSSRNAGSLKFELTANVYPLMRMSLEIISGFMDYMISEKEGEEEDEVKKELIDNLEETKEAAQKVLDIVNPEKEINEDDIAYLKNWANEVIENAEKILDTVEE